MLPCFVVLPSGIQIDSSGQCGTMLHHVITTQTSMTAKQSCVRFPNECILMRLFYWHSSLSARPEAPREGQQERKTHKHNKYCSLVQKFGNIFLKAFYCVIEIYNVGIVLRHCTKQSLNTTMHKEMTC